VRKIILSIPILIVLTDIAIWLNIPIFRGIIAFVFLSFIPGFVLLKILKLDERNLVDTILLSAGLSIAFSMFIGLLINELYLIGFSQSLSTVPLTVGLSLSTLVLFLVGYWHDLSENFSSKGIQWNVTRGLVSRSVILVLLPVLGVVGALFLNIPILLLLIIVIAVLYASSVLSTRLVPSKLYPLMIFTISLALLFHVVFTSNYIIGYDANLEYYVFKLTQINGHWSFLNANINPAQTVNYNSMLSITILPAIYSALLNISGEMLFKVLYSFVFSLVPVTLYRLYERQIGKLASLLSVFFLISGILVFYGVGIISLNRQIVAELFLVLSIFILLDKKISINKRRSLLIVFGVALVVSHYSLMYIYLILISIVYAVSKIKKNSDEVLNSAMVISLFAMAFSWYGFSVSPLSSMAQFLSVFFSKFSTDIVSPAARTTHTYLSQPISNVTNSISFVIFVAAQFLVAIGILGIIFKPKKTGLDIKYRMISILSGVILFSSLALPNFAPSLNLERFYAISLLFLAPCFALGFGTLLDLSKSIWGKATGQHLFGNRSTQIGALLLCALLVGFLLTQSGFVNRIAGSSPLLRSLDVDRLKTSSDRQVEIDFLAAYLPEQNVFGAVWLQKYGKMPSTVYADYLSQVGILTSYGLIPLQLMRQITNTTILEQGSYVYFGRLNIVNDVITTLTPPSTSYTAQFNFSEVLPLFNQTDTIYSNGNAEILYAISP
jgi:uncharacterized membrane protein